MMGAEVSACDPKVPLPDTIRWCLILFDEMRRSQASTALRCEEERAAKAKAHQCGDGEEM